MFHIKTLYSYVFPSFGCVEPPPAPAFGQADQTQMANRSRWGVEVSSGRMEVDEPLKL
jgi:hypothetical protein